MAAKGLSNKQAGNARPMLVWTVCFRKRRREAKCDDRPFATSNMSCMRLASIRVGSESTLQEESASYSMQEKSGSWMLVSDRRDFNISPQFLAWPEALQPFLSGLMGVTDFSVTTRTVESKAPTAVIFSKSGHASAEKRTLPLSINLVQSRGGVFNWPHLRSCRRSS